MVSPWSLFSGQWCRSSDFPGTLSCLPGRLIAGKPGLAATDPSCARTTLTVTGRAPHPLLWAPFLSSRFGFLGSPWPAGQGPQAKAGSVSLPGCSPHVFVPALWVPLAESGCLGQTPPSLAHLRPPAGRGGHLGVCQRITLECFRFPRFLAHFSMQTPECDGKAATLGVLAFLPRPTAVGAEGGE